MGGQASLFQAGAAGPGGSKMPEGGDVAAQRQQEEGGGTSTTPGLRGGGCGIISHHILIIVIVKSFQRGFCPRSAVVPLLGTLGLFPHLKSGFCPFFQDTNVLRQMEVVSPLGFFPLVNALLCV